MTVSPLCAYDGFPYDAPLLGPWPAREVLSEAWAEPQSYLIFDPRMNGDVLGRAPVPASPCRQCGTLTTRVRILELLARDVGPGAGGFHRWTQFVPVREPECPQCSRARDDAMVGKDAAGAAHEP
jgi:hypothetical protein